MSESKKNEKSNSKITRSKVRNKTEETEMKNIAEEQKTLDKIDELAADLIDATEVITRKSEVSALKNNISELQAAITTLKAASVVSIGSQQTQKRIIKNPDINDCGCDEPKIKQCCIEIFGSAIIVRKASDGIGTSLELLIAVEINGVKTVYPGLVTPIKVNKNSGWIKVYWKIATVCVPCNETISIPITVEAMDLDDTGKPETGVTTGSSMRLKCSSEICSTIIPVDLNVGSIGVQNGQIEVEISAKKVSNSCCC